MWNWHVHDNAIIVAVSSIDHLQPRFELSYLYTNVLCTFYCCSIVSLCFECECDVQDSPGVLEVVALGVGWIEIKCRFDDSHCSLANAKRVESMEL